MIERPGRTTTGGSIPRHGKGQDHGPAWRRDEGLRQPPRRWQRPRERWEREGEAYPGATVLEDLDALSPVGGELAGVIARFAAVRFVHMLLDDGDELPGGMVIMERLAAVAYLNAPFAVGPTEHRALERVLRHAAREPTPDLASALCHAGQEATARKHEHGAFALFRTAYQLSLSRGWPSEAARAAAGIARLAAAGGGYWSERRWRRRANALGERARRAT